MKDELSKTPTTRVAQKSQRLCQPSSTKMRPGQRSNSVLPNGRLMQLRKKREKYDNYKNDMFAN